MPTLSASEYTRFVKLQAAQPAYATNVNGPRPIQTVDRAVVHASQLNAELLASQVALKVQPQKAAITSAASVRPRPALVVNNPRSLSGATQLHS